jgi:signal transduction histidine kinase
LPNRIGLRLPSLVLAVLCILTFRPALADDTRRVLIVSPFDNSLPALNLLEASIRSEMRRELTARFAIYTEFLNLEQFPGPGYATQAASFLSNKYGGLHIDVVIAIAPEALDFLLQRRDYLFADSQLMFSWVPKDQLAAFHVPPDVPGIVTFFNTASTVDLALRLQPDATRMIVVSGTTEADRHDKALETQRLKGFAQRLSIDYWSKLAMADLLRAVGQLPHGTFVLDTGVIRDGAGQPFVAWQVDEKLAAASSVPVYCIFQTFIGHGNVGGVVEDFEAEGRQTGQLAVQLLLKQQHSTGKRILAATSTIVDWRQVRRWGLNSANLPPGAIVRFRKPSLWEEHKWLVISAVVVLIVQSIFIGLLIIQARRRQRAQTALELQQQALTHLGRVATLGELSGAIAHEINNPLTAILSNAQAAARFLARTPIDIDELQAIHRDIAADSKRAGEVLQRLRGLFRKAETRLEPVNLNGIVTDVLELAKQKLLDGNVTVTTKLANNIPETRADPIQLKQVLLNIVINACDAMEDAELGDRILIIATSYDQGMAQVSISDRGSGISESVKERIFQPFVTTKPTGTGLGLSICRSIIEAHGGRLWASNNPDRGATFGISLPIDSHLT